MWQIISIHAPTRGATVFKNNMLQNPVNFNPRSHERSDKLFDSNYFKSKISIHAPTRGATFRKLCISCSDFISIHAPTRGATILLFLVKLTFGISIHAPTRGATSTGANQIYKQIKFQSTLPREERP